MPLVHQEAVLPSGVFGIWQIDETETWFQDRLQLQASERHQLAPIKGHRRLEWLAVRQLIHELSGQSPRQIVLKDEFGKPHLPNSNRHISVSHSRVFGAAILSPKTVGIDIQKLVPKITSIQHKFLNPEEIKGLDPENRILQLHVYWGAKEALYKAYGRKELDFCKNIIVRPFKTQAQSGQCSGTVIKGVYQKDFDIYYQLFEQEYMLVYAIAPK